MEENKINQEKIDLRNLNLFQFQELLEAMEYPKYRAEQIFKWIYKGKTNIRDMGNVPKDLIESLEEKTEIATLKVQAHRKSKKDGTEKILFRLKDGNAIESVLMKYKYGNTICISSQVGCRMGCVFCASGQLGLERNLTAGEMVSQVLDMELVTGSPVNHIVVMGTGEPFDNYENLSKFLKIINNPKGKNLGMRNITVSTCGIIPRIMDFSKDFPQVNLAISLHGTTDYGRTAIMPINKKYPLKDLIQTCKEYTKETGRRITFEYTLVKGVNDKEEDAMSLAGLLRGMLCHINVIPLNKVEESGLTSATTGWANSFAKVLDSRRIPVTVRRELGGDIEGACGQLRLVHN